MSRSFRDDHVVLQLRFGQNRRHLFREGSQSFAFPAKRVQEDETSTGVRRARPWRQGRKLKRETKGNLRLPALIHRRRHIQHATRGLFVAKALLPAREGRDRGARVENSKTKGNQCKYENYKTKPIRERTIDTNCKPFALQVSLPPPFSSHRSGIDRQIFFVV